MSQPIAEDGNLPAARQDLKHAIHQLTQPIPALINNKLHHAPALYMQLRDAIRGEQGTGYNGAPQSQPPLWVEAIDLLNEIDTAVEIWQPQPAGVPPTIGRLNALNTKTWRPQDVRNIQQITTACQQWAAKIENTLNPGHVKHFRAPDGDGYAPCPQCGKATTYRTDPADGEPKRVPTLQWVAETGTTCIVCRSSWDPFHTLWLGRVLGFELPEGVLE